MYDMLALGCIAAVASFAINSLVCAFAPRWGLIDRPDGHHKSHARELALGGGLGVFLAAAITIALGYLSFSQLQSLVHEDQLLIAGLFFASTWIVILGLIDDRFGMRGRYKLLGQLLAVLVIVAAGLEIHRFSIFGQEVNLGWFSIPFTVFWLLGAINSLNLLDGIDGLATTIGIILCSTIAVIAVVIGRPDVALIAAVFVGSLVGFLRFNFPPARMFLGDAGSMLIGLVVGTLAIRGSMKGPATLAMAAPLAIWAIPIFDSVAAILRRKLSGRSIYASDRGHLHHQLMGKFGNNRRVLAVVAFCCIVTCAGALVGILMNNDLVALLSVLSVLSILIVTQAFGHVELVMVLTRFKALGHALVGGKVDRKYSFRLQGDREWKYLWESVIEFSEKLDLVAVLLDVNLAAAQEGFHASWQRPTKSEREERWTAEVPLFSGSHVIGRLRVSGNRTPGMSTCEAIYQVMELLEPLEAEIVFMATNPECREIRPLSTINIPATRSKAVSSVPVSLS